MNLINFHISLAILLHVTQGFIFNRNDCDTNSLLNWKYDDKCQRNETVMTQVNEFKTKFDKIKRLSRNELRFIRRRGFRAVFTDICEGKRDIARTMTDCIQPIADFCVNDPKIRKEFVLNTLLVLKTTLDFICGMNQSNYEDIYINDSARCFVDKLQVLQICQRSSFEVYFWEKVPEKPATLIQLINGSICNFNFDKMLKCSSEVLQNDVMTALKYDSCSSSGAFEVLSYEIEVVKRNSLCFKTRNLSDAIDNSSSESIMSDVVS